MDSFIVPEGSFFAGNSGQEPGIYLISVDGKEKLIKRVDNNRSIYAVSYLANKSLLGFGTRNKPNDINGTVEVYKVTKSDSYSDEIKLEKLFFAYTRYSTFCFEFFSDNIFLSGGLDGSIFIWRLSQSKPFEIPNAHQGMILKLSPVTDTIFASLGIDSKLKFWDVNTGIPHYIIDESDEPPQIQNFIKFFNVPENGIIISHHSSGTIKVHDFNEGLKSRNANFNGGKASSISVFNDKIILSSINYSAIKVFSISSEKELFHFNCEKTIRALEFINNDNFIVVYLDGRSEIWNISDSKNVVTPLKLNNIRSVNSQVQRFSKDLTKVEHQLSQEMKIEGLKNLLQQDNFNLLNIELQKYINDGLSIEVMVLLAEWCKSKNKPLWELKVRIEFCEELPLHQFSAVHFYALAELLENINEPAKALHYYQICLKCDTDYKDVKDKIKNLGTFTERENINIFYEYPDIKLVTQEINKKLILKENLSAAYKIKSINDESSDISKTIVKLKSILSVIEGGNWELKDFELLNGEQKKILFSKITLPTLNDFYYGFSIRQVESHQFYEHLVFFMQNGKNVSEELIENFNKAILFINANEFNSWFNSAQQSMRNAVKKAFKEGLKYSF